jgi:hypothetical protein
MTKQVVVRRLHRYLGVFIGIQFLAWTVSGLYFSFNDLDDVHGDHLRKHPSALLTDSPLVSPDKVIAALKSSAHVHAVQSIQLISLGGKPLYQIAYFPDEGAHHRTFALADASTGLVRQPLSREEAVMLAKDHVVSTARVTNVAYLENAGPDHEYRERPLPAYAVSFEDPECTVYISTRLGSFQAIRHDQWRIFDFLWMFHTMDYEGRDDINNWLLRIFSVFGLLTVASGLGLFAISSRRLRKLFARNTQRSAGAVH